MLSELLNKLKELLLWFPKKVLEWVLDALVSLIEKIPVPQFFSKASNAFSSIPGDVLFYLEPFEVGYGLSVMIAAYIIRFIIRRIPLIG